MAARKLQQEVDKCFKKVSEGVAEFESIYEKIEQSTNAAQKEKLEDNLKREIKKLQRSRDQIKTWAASNDIKDKTPLLENRKLIETQMEKFKAVEKAMKTKAYSKEGLSAAAKLDPKERAKLEACDFLGNMVDELERQIETLEAEGEAIGATLKKGKNHSTKADRIAEIERITERHKWHQGKLELIKRSLENGGVETDQITDLEESIRYYVSDGANEDYEGEGDEMYDDLNLEEEEDAYGMNNENDRLSSQDNQSVQEESADTDARSGSIPGAKSKPAVSEPPVTFGRRPSTQLKSPLPALATLHNPSSISSNGNSTNNMKPASIPTRAPGEPLKYASAAAAATNNVGIAPLPPPPGTTPPSGTSISTALLPVVAPSRPTTSSPVTSSTQPVVTPQSKSSLPVTTSLAEIQASSTQNPSPALSQSSTVPNLTISASRQATPSTEKSDPARPEASQELSGKVATQLDPTDESKAEQRSNGTTNGTREANPEDGDESVYHLPSGLQDLIQSFEVTQSRPFNLPSQSSQRMMDASWDGRITAADMEQPRNYKPKYRFNTPAHYPQEPLPIFDNPQLYSRIDPDTLFYVFYYRQGSYQQYLAAKSLKDQSWRFHKQYQTWFQRHEEPKTITDEFEQGTYRFFDYESTWMNRRKADFKFVYKFLEDDV